MHTGALPRLCPPRHAPCAVVTLIHRHLGHLRAPDGSPLENNAAHHRRAFLQRLLVPRHNPLCPPPHPTRWSRMPPHPPPPRPRAPSLAQRLAPPTLPPSPPPPPQLRRRRRRWRRRRQRQSPCGPPWQRRFTGATRGVCCGPPPPCPSPPPHLPRRGEVDDHHPRRRGPRGLPGGGSPLHCDPPDTVGSARGRGGCLRTHSAAAAADGGGAPRDGPVRVVGGGC